MEPTLAVLSVFEVILLLQGFDGGGKVVVQDSLWWMP
jgi:hypothetical protein